jgi:hypothetical protein
MPNVCGTPPCKPSTCASLGFDCGVAVDPKCGGVLHCGSCTAPETCGGGGKANVCGGGCDPMSCSSLGFTCGATGDGCGNLLQCGTCPYGADCIDNMCVFTPCVPQTCVSLDANCGLLGDGCGDVLDCGTCTAPETCGGAGVPNQCG